MIEETPDGKLRDVIAGSPIAGFWRRVAAFLVDTVILAIPLMVVGFTFFEWAVGLGQAGRLVGFTVALLYFGLLNSRINGGQTLGKRLLRIRVIDRTGEMLSPARSVLRFLVLWVPYFLNGVFFDAPFETMGMLDYLLGLLIVFVVFGGLLAIIYLLIFNRRTRQSLHDLAVGSFVVRGAPAAVPAKLATPRLHLVMVAGLLALALIGPGVALKMMTAEDSGTSPLLDLQAAIQSEFGVEQVNVTMGQTTTSWARKGTSTTTYLQIQARASNGHGDLPALRDQIAA
ncbi:MAG: RDD family protein, partial [Rhodospirillales bacterium]|nr:RDD family protein [Rhodospirillales bacterium]